MFEVPVGCCTGTATAAQARESIFLNYPSFLNSNIGYVFINLSHSLEFRWETVAWCLISRVANVGRTDGRTVDYHLTFVLGNGSCSS